MIENFLITFFKWNTAEFMSEIEGGIFLEKAAKNLKYFQN